ncbi:MAG: DUF4364 family protein [Lachnospirales bacterium]
MSSKVMAGNKMVLLFVLYQMDMDMSWTTLHDFAVPDYMDYFDFSTYLEELEENNLVESYSENNIKYYSITESGEQSLHYFSRLIPESKRNSILSFIRKNKKRIKKEYAVYANYFYHNEDEYVVKCGVIEDDMTLLELNVTVVTKEQAKLVRKNWKENCNVIYNDLLKGLLKDNYVEKDLKKKKDTSDFSSTKNKKSNLG